MLFQLRECYGTHCLSISLKNYCLSTIFLKYQLWHTNSKNNLAFPLRGKTQNNI